MNVRSMTIPVSEMNQLSPALHTAVRSRRATPSLRFRQIVMLAAGLLAMPLAAETSAPAPQGEAEARSTAPLTGMVERTFCVWDPVGSSGPIVGLVRNAQPAMMAIGVKLNIQAYT